MGLGLHGLLQIQPAAADRIRSDQTGSKVKGKYTMMNQEKLYKLMQDDLLNRDGPCTLYRMSDYWTMVTSKYYAVIMPHSDVDTICTGTQYTTDSSVHRRIDNTLNGSDMFYVGTMTVSINMLKQKVIVFKDDFGLFYLIRYTAAADYLARLKRKDRRIKRYQDLIVFWSPDDDFPIMACCEVSGNKVKGE